MDKKTIISLMSARKIVLICFILASLILAIANSNIQFADARKSADNGDIEFIRQFGTSDVDAATDVFADSSEAVYAIGFTDDTLPDQTSQGGRDAFIRKYNSDGDEIWTRQFGTTELDFVGKVQGGGGISVDSSGVYVAGQTSGGTFPDQTSEGGVDAFLAKLAIDDHKKKHNDDKMEDHHDDDAKKKH
jgi:hypothetical protein